VWISKSFTILVAVLVYRSRIDGRRNAMRAMRKQEETTMNAMTIDSGKRRFCGRGAPAAITLALLLAGGAAPQVWGQLYWSANGTSAGGSGTWDTTNERWGTAAGGPFTTVWDNTANASTRAIIQTSPGTVTIQPGGISVGQIEPAGTWVFDGGPITLGSRIGNKDGGTDSYNATFKNDISIASPGTFQLRNTGTRLTIEGQLSGSGLLTITGVGVSVTLAGDNSGLDGGIFKLSGPAMVLGHNSALGTGEYDADTGNIALSATKALTIANNFKTRGTASGYRTLTLSGDHAMEFTGGFSIGNASGTAVLNVDVTSSEVMTWSGAISQSVSGTNVRGLRKRESGTLVLSGPNTYLGATTVRAGTLYLDGTTTGMADHIVQTGGTLGGTGTVGLATDKLLTVETGGTLAPGTVGAPVGTFTVNGDVTLESETTYLWDYANGVGDRVTVNGTLTLPSVVTTVVNQVTGTLPVPATLFSATALAGETDLSGWVIEGLDTYEIAIDGTSVILKSPPGGSLFLLR